MSVGVFLPCRKGSQRVNRKNIKPFYDYDFGLLQIKLQQLISSKKIDHIYLTSNDDEVLSYARSLNNSKISLHCRIDSLSDSKTSTDMLIGHAYELVQHEHILWTHVTSPFVTSDVYDIIIEEYEGMLLRGFDSLMTSTMLYSFLWADGEPINYDRAKEKWPQTQTLPLIHEINSAVFISSLNNYKIFKDRIGVNPYLYPLNKIQGFDIDWEDDFKIAEAIAKSGVGII